MAASLYAQRNSQRILGATVEPAVVDFLAVDADGRPVGDLTPEEIRLKVDGREREVRSLQFIRVAGSIPSLDRAPGEELPRPFGTNVTRDAGRVVALVIDEETIEPGRLRSLRQAIVSFLSALSPRDRIALITVPRGGLQVNFTRDRQRVADALANIAPQASQQTDSEAACRTRLTLDALIGALDSISRTADNPAIFIFVSSSQVGPASTIQLAGTRMCELLPEHFMNVGVAAARARALFYLMLPDDPVMQSGLVHGRVGLESLGGITGGPLINLSDAEGAGLLRIARESSAYYLASFTPTMSERSGSTHELALRVTRRGVTVRARPDLVIAKSETRPSSRKPPADMLREPGPFSALPLRDVAYAVRDTAAGTMRVIGLLEAADPSVTLMAAGAALFDATGRLVTEWTARPADLGGSTVTANLIAPPGIYRLRMAATDSSGRGGAADYDLAAQLTPAGSWQMSTIALGVSRGKRFEPKVLFGSDPSAIASIEIYGHAPNGRPDIAIAFELATAINGPAIVVMPAAIDPTAQADRFVVTAAVPLGSVPAGDFVVRAIAQPNGEPAGRVVRTVRKTG